MAARLGTFLIEMFFGRMLRERYEEPGNCAERVLAVAYSLDADRCDLPARPVYPTRSCDEANG